MKYKVKITLTNRIQKPFQGYSPTLKREVFYHRSGHWIYHCEYGPAIEFCVITPYTKRPMETFYLRNRKMGKKHWGEVLPKLRYLK
jgi:hypothetical protein